MEWPELLLPAATALLGGGGVAAFLRSRGQNKADLMNALTAERSALAKEQADYRAAITAEIATIRQREALQDQREEAQERRNQELSTAVSERTREIGGLQAQVGGLQAQVNVQTDRIRELEALYRASIEDNAKLSARLDQIEKERAAAVQRLQTEMATREFLERENNDFRKENERLRGQLPPREIATKPGLRDSSGTKE